MEKILYIVIILLVLILVILLITITAFLYKYLKLKEGEKLKSSPLDKDHPSFKKIPLEVKSSIEQAKESRKQLVGSFCVDHPDLPAKGRCGISDELYCELCLTKENDVKIARKFLSLFLDNDWPTHYLVNNNEVGADRLNEIMRVKKELWKSKQIPVITQRQFKINIENDKIEIFTAVMFREIDKEIALQRFGFLHDH